MHFIIHLTERVCANLLFSSSGMCCCRLESFDKARKSSGTDEDILFIYKRQRPVASHEEEMKVGAEAVSL